MSINKCILKEYQTMSLQSFSDGQIDVVFPDESDLTDVRVTLKPNDGYYKDGKFDFAVKLPTDYPNGAPTVTCLTKIFHPNIAYTGYICFNILSDEWDSSLRLVDYVHSLLWLLYQPNLNSRLNGDCPQDLDLFARLVRQSIEGGVVCGTTFPCALADPSLRRDPPMEEPRPQPVEPQQPRPQRARTWIHQRIDAVEYARPRPGLAPVTVQPITPVSIRDLRARFEELARTNIPVVRRAAAAQPQPQPQPEQPAPVPQPQEPQQAPQPEQQPVPQQPEPQQPQPEQPAAAAEQPAQPEQPELQQQQPAPQPAAAPLPRTAYQPVPRHLSWAQFIMPTVQQTPPSTPPLAPRRQAARRWAPVVSPATVRYVGSVRVY